jgi:hypothetical protein
VLNLDEDKSTKAFLPMVLDTVFDEILATGLTTWFTTWLLVGRSADLRFNSRSNDATRRSLRQ